jgi:predicted membrane protein
MFDFDQYLGFLAFLTILTIGFWLMFFLIAIIPYWIGGVLLENFKMKREAKRKAREEE